MATTTNNFSLPYPQGNDPYNIPEDIANLAKSIDSSLKAVSDSVATIEYSTTETVEEVKKNLEILEQEINRAGLPNIERIMVDIEEARDELEAAKEEFSVGQAELGVHLTNLRDERMPALEESVQEARNEMDTAMDEFMTRQTQFEDSISDAETEIADAKQRLGQNEDEIAAAKQDVIEAQSTADQAVQDALDAAGIAEGKGQVITQISAPTGSRAKAENLWIRLPDHKVHIYDGSDWVAATDPDLIEAATTASDALTTANDAQSRAEALEKELDRAGGIKDRLETALEGEVDHDRLRVGTGGFDEVFAREVVAGIIGAEKAEVIDLIAEDLIADNATLINAAMQNLTVTERANFVDAFAKELYAERFTAEVARISNLTVAARNLIPGMFNIANENPPPFDVDGFGRNPSDPSVWIQGRSTVNTSAEEDALIYLEAGVNYKISMETAASVPGTMYYVQLMHENGSSATDTVVELAETSYLLSQEIAGPNKDNWWPAESTFWVQKTGGYRLKIFANHNRGEPNLDGYQWFRNMRVENMNDGRLIVPNSIDASRLNAYEVFANEVVSDQIWANAVRTKLLEANEALIGGALIKKDTITVDKLDALDEILTEMLRVRKIEAGDIAADAITADKIDADAITAGKIASGAIDGKTITGSRVRTSASGKRVEMYNDAMTAYNSSGSIQARYSGSGIELRPPGGSLTEIGPHIFGAEFFTSPDRSRSNYGSNSWSSVTTNTSLGSMFIPSNRVRISLSFQYIIGLAGTNTYRGLRFYPRIGGLSKRKTLSLNNQPANTSLNFSYEDVYNVGSIQGTTANILIALSVRAVNVTISGISLTVTPV